MTGPVNGAFTSANKAAVVRMEVKIIVGKHFMISELDSFEFGMFRIFRGKAI